MLILNLLIWLSLSLAKSDKFVESTGADEEKVSAPFPLGPKIKTSQPKVAQQDPDIYVTDADCGEPRPFYVPGETLGIYTETVTETIFLTHTTSKIIDVGTSTTLTRSLTVTTTTVQTTTILDVSTSFATTTVALSQTVFGGTVTSTKIIDTTIVSTLYITPIAATSESFVTKFTRSTVTISVTGTTVARTLETVTTFSFDTFSVLNVEIIFESTSTLSVTTNQPIVETVFKTLTAYTSPVTPTEFTAISEIVTLDVFLSTVYGQVIFGTGGPVVTLTGKGTLTAFNSDTEIISVTQDISVSSLFTFTDYTFFTSLIN